MIRNPNIRGLGCISFRQAIALKNRRCVASIARTFSLPPIRQTEEKRRHCKRTRDGHPEFPPKGSDNVVLIASQACFVFGRRGGAGGTPPPALGEPFAADNAHGEPNAACNVASDTSPSLTSDSKA